MLHPAGASVSSFLVASFIDLTPAIIPKHLSPIDHGGRGVW
ncbi:MAG: hypothetical protein U5L72_09425 [Bacteroidales bacterium]|nr:hypothetical protein [Bacteroidales bacterium]